MNETESGDYFLEIEAHFAQKRGTPFVVSAKDWALIKSWSDGSIPLSVVIEAIDQCFEKREKSGRKQTISSLSYCRHAVRELWEERRDLQVGGMGAVPEADPGAHLETLAQSLEGTASSQQSIVSDFLTTTAGEVRQSAKAKSVPQIEERLMAIEQSMIDGLMEIMPDEEKETLKQEADQLLSEYTNLDPEIVRKSRAANLRRLLRKKYALPRLSLFG